MDNWEDIKNNAWVTVNNDFLVTSEVICQWFSRVTKSRKWKSLANHLTSDQNIVIYGNECVILFLTRYFLLRPSSSTNGIFRLSVCLSHLFDYVPIIVSSCNFQELLSMTKVRSMQKVKIRGQRSRSQRSQPNATVSGLWLQFEFTYDDEMMHIAWCCLEEVPYCFSRSSVKFQGHTALKIVEFDPNWPFPDSNSSLNIPMATKWCTKLGVALKRCPIVFQGHSSNFKVTRLKKLSNLTQIGRFRTVTPVWIYQWLRNYT